MTRRRKVEEGRDEIWVGGYVYFRESGELEESAGSIIQIIQCLKEGHAYIYLRHL